MNPLSVHLAWLIGMVPLAVASMAASMPISLPSRFSWPCDAIIVVPLSTGAVLMARLLIRKCQTGSPVSDLDGMNASVTESRDQQAGSVNPRDDGAGVVGVEGAPAGRAHPNDLPGTFVQCDQPD